MDDLDRQLLVQLRVDARVSMAELGRRVGLSRTATLARVRRLEDAGVIAGYHADVRVEGSKGTVARVGIVVRTPNVGTYVRRLEEFVELREAESVTGEYDLLVRFDPATPERLDAILDRINGWKETIRTTTFMVLRRYPLPHHR